MRRTLLLLPALGWFWMGVASPPAFAHGDLHGLIQNVTREIEQAPRNPELYLRRAELHRAHEGWDAALADIERATVLTNQYHVLHLARARVYLDAGWFESAKVTADRFLAQEPNNPEALTLRARAKVKLVDRLAAVEDYSRAITNASPPSPDLFLERAQTLAAAGSNYLESALQGLEQGLARLGPLVTLQLPALELELKQNRVDAALARLDKVMAQFPRKETWLARRGEILQSAGRNAEATEAFRAALKALDALPPTRRAVPAMTELEQRVRAALAAVAPPAASTPPASPR
jgi:tetratricopeptide (TPR) repeat protein